jgi:two-component system chemotaxis sensor kinase CheA
MRVEVTRLDRTLDLVGELAIARGRVSAALARGDRQAALAMHESAEAIFQDLQARVLGLRMVPLRTVLDPLHRAVRDLGARVGKEARLVLPHGEVEVDVAVAEALRAPLAHLLRNAIDHGLEAPDARQRAGKPRAGTITISARHDGGSLVVAISDDGAGLDRERLLARGRALGLTVDERSDEAVWALAFAPGLSTADGVSDLSGRGIGMDVVRRVIEALRGHVRLTSRAGAGVTVTLRLPLTLSIVQGLAVEVTPETIVVPVESVRECVTLDPGRVVASLAGGVLELRGEALPFLDLGRALGFSAPAAAATRVVVVEEEGRRAGLAVHAFHQEIQTVIRPLGPLFAGVTGLAGSAILGDGRVALVADVRALLRASF